MPKPRPETAEQLSLIRDFVLKNKMGARKIAALNLPELAGLGYQVIQWIIKREGLVILPAPLDPRRHSQVD